MLNFLIKIFWLCTCIISFQGHCFTDNRHEKNDYYLFFQKCVKETCSPTKNGRNKKNSCLRSKEKCLNEYYKIRLSIMKKNGLSIHNKNSLILLYQNKIQKNERRISKLSILNDKNSKRRVRKLMEDNNYLKNYLKEINSINIH